MKSDLEALLIERYHEMLQPLLQNQTAPYFECRQAEHTSSDSSGYDVLVWALECGLLPSRVQLVTSNPVGRANMANALKSANYSSADGINFVATGKSITSFNRLSL